MEFIKYVYKTGRNKRIEIYYVQDNISYMALFSKHAQQTDWKWLWTKIFLEGFENDYEIISNDKNEQHGERHHQLLSELEPVAFELLSHPAVEMALWFKDND